MSERRDIEQAIASYIEAINTDNANIIPLAADAVMNGPMMPEPVHGELAIRQHIADTAPFIARIAVKTTVIENDNAAVVVVFEGLNGLKIEGAYIFRFAGGLICHVQVFFDTRFLYKGAK
jgi:ketosteroid isomerase-like protein